MQSSLVDFAVRTREGGRRLTLAEADRSTVGDALAVLFEDPEVVSSAWPAAVDAYGRIWSGHKSFQPIMDITDLLEHVLPGLDDDPDLVAAIGAWSGRELCAWALPAALVLARCEDGLFVLEADGFRAVSPDGDLGSAAADTGMRRGRLELRSDDRFVLMSRAYGARVGLWRFDHALRAPDLDAALEELGIDPHEGAVIVGQIGARVTSAEESLSALASAAVGVKDDEPETGDLFAAGKLEWEVAESETGANASSPPADVVEQVEEGAAPATGEDVVETVEASETIDEPEQGEDEFEIEQPVPVAAGMNEELMTGDAGEWSTATVAGGATAGEPPATDVPPAPEASDDRLLERHDDTWLDEMRTVADEAAADAPERPEFFVRDRHRRRRRDPEEQGSLFQPRGDDDPTEPTPEPGETARQLISGPSNVRIRARKTVADRHGNVVVRGLTWIGLGVSVVLTLAIIILLARFIRPPEGPDVPAADLETAGEPVDGVPSDPANAAALPPLEIFSTANWSRAFDQAITSSPVLVGEQAVFGCRDGNLLALDIRQGTEVWSTSIGSGIGSSPAAHDGRIVVGTYDGEVVAVDATTGEPAWRYTTGDRIVSSPAITADGIVVVGSNDNHLYGLSLADGTLQWKVGTGDNIWASPALSTTSLAVVGSHDRSIYCVDATAGEVQWHLATGAPIYSSAAVLDDRVAVGSGDHRVRALSLADGTELWNVDAGAPVNGSVAAGEDAFVFGTDSGAIICVEATNGTQRWSVETGGAIKSRPRVADGFVWVTGYDKQLHVIDLATGERRWNFEADGRLFSSPAVKGRTAFFGAMSGTFYAATWHLSPRETGDAESDAASGVTP